jgi:hypothetical protein
LVSGRIAACQADRSLPSTKVVVMPEARQHGLQDIAAGAEQGAGGYDVIARLQSCQEHGGDSRHAGSGGARHRRAFEQRHALFEHGNGGIGDATILIAWALALEAGSGLFGVLIGIAGGEDQRLAGFLEGGTDLSAAHRLGAFAPFARFFVGSH